MCLSLLNFFVFGLESVDILLSNIREGKTRTFFFISAFIRDSMFFFVYRYEKQNKKLKKK